jgi:hypothetical protein
VAGERRGLSRSDLPAELTAESVRGLPLSLLRRFGDHRNGVLTAEEQRAFDAAVHEVMSETAGRVSQQMSRSEWSTVLRDAHGRGKRQGGPEGASRVDDQLRRIARRIEQQVDAAEALAPGVDWSFAQSGRAPVDGPATTPAEVPPASSVEAPVEPPAETPDAPETGTTDPAAEDHDDADDHETLTDLEERLTEQVELVQVMSEIADVGRRTYALEQQRDLQSTRTVFFGFVVSVAVLVAGWAPIVAADDWSERIWILVLTLVTCVVAGAVYGLVRRYQERHEADPADDAGS